MKNMNSNMSIHRVESLIVGTQKRHETKNGVVHFTQTIKIFGDGNNRFELTLFSDQYTATQFTD